MKTNKKAISLIVLIITIIVLAILATAPTESWTMQFPGISPSIPDDE